MLALGKGPETLGKGFAEGCPRQRPLGEFLDGEGVFAEGQDGPRQRKEAVRRRRRWRFLCRGPTLGKEMVFFLNLFAEGRPSANKSFYFFLNLCRGPPLWPSAKKYSGFFKNSLPRAGPRQRNGFFEFLTLCRGPTP